MWGSETQVTLHPLWSSALLGLCQAAVPALQLLLSPSDKTVPLFQFTKEHSMSRDSAIPWAATRRPWPCTLMSPFLGKSKLFIFSYGKLFSMILWWLQCEMFEQWASNGWYYLGRLGDLQDLSPAGRRRLLRVSLKVMLSSDARKILVRLPSITLSWISSMTSPWAYMKATSIKPLQSGILQQ